MAADRSDVPTTAARRGSNILVRVAPAKPRGPGTGGDATTRDPRRIFRASDASQDPACLTSIPVRILIPVTQGDVARRARNMMPSSGPAGDRTAAPWWRPSVVALAAAVV